MEEIIYPLLNGVAHITTGAFAGKASRKLLKYEYNLYNDSETENTKNISSYQNKKSKFNEILYSVSDAFLGLSPDSDIVVNFFGEHRGYLHIPYVELLYGFSFGLIRDVAINRKLKIKNAIKNGISAAVATITHFLIDLGSGGKIPISFNQYILPHQFLQGYDNILYHGIIAISSLAGIFYISYMNRRNKL
jgi:hypothetical protein